MNSSHRLHALDAARGFALLLGIVLHATMSFFTIIPAQDVSQSTTLAVTFYVIHLCRLLRSSGLSSSRTARFHQGSRAAHRRPDDGRMAASGAADDCCGDLGNVEVVS